MDINAIPNNRETYMAFMLGKYLVFVNSFQFMSSSLGRLAANLSADAFKYTSHAFQAEKLALTWIVKRSLMTSNCRPQMISTVC